MYEPKVICETCGATMGPCFCKLEEWEREDECSNQPEELNTVKDRG